MAGRPARRAMEDETKARTGRDIRAERLAAKAAGLKRPDPPPHHTDEWARPLDAESIGKRALDHIASRAAGPEPVTFAELCGVVGGKNALALTRQLKALEAEKRILSSVEGRVVAYKPVISED